MASFVDVSVPLRAGMPSWPGDPPFRVERFLDMAKGDGVNASGLRMSAHAGTHIDAPNHHLPGADGADRASFDALVGPAVVADLPDAEHVTAADLEALRLPAGTERLLLKTRNSRRPGLWSTPFWEGFAALAPDGAAWAVARGLRLVGIDYLSIQPFLDPTPATHVTLLRGGATVLEGLDLTRVRPGRYRLLCLPLRVEGCDGAPARAVLVEER